MKPLWFIVHPETGARLCQDKRWRMHAPLGTESNCVKFYKTHAWAEKIAWHFHVNGESLIKALHSDEVLDAAGVISKKES
ncbi:MAG: hypothetical protein U9R60_14645 [Bacteroidota bacterium]|nr:hypothetical protein [Bacteroidota bacterium]